jgi:hypothetical protein
MFGYSLTVPFREMARPEKLPHAEAEDSDSPGSTMKACGTSIPAILADNYRDIGQHPLLLFVENDHFPRAQLCICRGSIPGGCFAIRIASAATLFDGVVGVAGGGLWCGPGAGCTNRLIGRGAGCGLDGPRAVFICASQR